MTTMEERIAAYDARRAQRVLNVERSSGATDALIVDALEAALLVIHAIHTTVAWHPPLDCEQCAALGKIHRALAALGK